MATVNKPDTVNTVNSDVNKPTDVNKPDRKAYMREYMRKRRLAKP